MKTLKNHLIGIDNGDVVMFSDFESGGKMWTGDGARKVTKAIKFSQSYKDVPMVNCWLSMWDVSNDTFGRMDVQAENITPEGFKIVFRTWGDTKVARVRVAWQSMGEMPHDDDWQLY